MTINKTKLALAITVAMGVAAPTSVFATNGYFAHGYGTKTKGLAGAGVALPQDTMDAATNPANMAFVGGGFDVGAGIFSPRREYTVTGGPSPSPAFGLQPGTVKSGSNYFLVPHLGYNMAMGSNATFGVTVYGNGGMNTDYPGDTGYGGGTFYGGFYGGEAGAGVDLSQLFITPTYAQKIGANAAWGVSGIIAYQMFEATGLAAYGANGFSTDPSNLTDKGHDSAWGFGAKLGIQGEVAPGFHLGASYQTETKMSEFDKYKGLFAEHGDFDVPATATIGLAYKPNKTSAIVFDVQRIWYSKVAAVANPLSNLFAGGALGGGSNAAGFGWEDMTVYKLGYQWQMDKDMTMRVGFSTGDQPIPTSEVLFNILAPGVMENHFTFGLTKNLDKNSVLDFAFMYAPSKSVKGPNPLDPAQTVELKMKQYEVELNWGWKF